ncbi:MULTISPECIES: antibiotic biosynthesis monooxygenase [Rhodococcus]|uniref:Possible membrane protein n=1 Tax=Rhodococcus jostii (strain RHA1) TaxID=101510 RepID=Q0SFH3_RHOJR|nr:MULTISPECIES: antibiotic biosynthesis monooxygenase [Rhodococcus]ABG93713.1 possible membrane protein [Rhodococcus jostii RHA1]
MEHAAEGAGTAGPVDASVTTTIVRRVLPGCDEEFADWIQTGLGLARLFPGFLGGGWLKESSTSDVCVIVLKFETQAALDNWLTSSLRNGWLRTGGNIAVEEPDEPASDVESLFERPRRRTAAGHGQAGSPGICAPDGIPSPK